MSMVESIAVVFELLLPWEKNRRFLRIGFIDGYF